MKSILPVCWLFGPIMCECHMPVTFPLVILVARRLWAATSLLSRWCHPVVRNPCHVLRFLLGNGRGPSVGLLVASTARSASGLTFS